MSAPVKNTCPDIDRYIKNIKYSIVKDRDLRNMKEKDLFDAAIEMSSELNNCMDYLEELRSSNSALRDWGEGLDKEVEESANYIAELEEKLEKYKNVEV